MKPRDTYLGWAAVVIACLLCRCAGSGEVVLLEDDFSLLKSGYISSDKGAHTEYHFDPSAYPVGNWNIAAFYHDEQSYTAWKVLTDGGKKVIAQRNRFQKSAFTHPMLVAGDSLWRDYQVALLVRPLDSLQTGLAFRYVNSNCYYFFGVERGQAVLKRNRYHRAFREADEQTLLAKPFHYSDTAYLKLEVMAQGNQIGLKINGTPIGEVQDSAFVGGKVGLLADGPAFFRNIRVTSSRKEAERVRDRAQALIREQRELAARNPKMEVVKKINTFGFGTGRNLRFGDLDGDGVIDILICQPLHHGPKDRNSEVGVLTAVDLEGNVLWQKGEPDPWKYHLTNDVGVQIHDLDGDGKNEVVYCKDGHIYVVEGKTGKLLRSRALPQVPGGPGKPPKRLLGDAVFFADFSGKGRNSDVVVKDRYNHFWVMDEHLNILWSASCKTGHYPYARDIDGDGRDELAIGYSMYTHDGRLLWSLDEELGDHSDGVALVDYSGNGQWMMMNAASDEGMLFIGTDGKIKHHHYLGHVQNPSVANYRDDMPGLETVSINFWGNQGIIHFFDASGELYHSMEPAHHGSMCLPLNWTGTGEEYFILSANPEIGGVFNGYGQKVMDFPDDGHPDMCYAVLDILGDVRDEIVVWDQYEIWIYTQDRHFGAEKRLYKPERNGLYNYSNYQATVSLPGWTIGDNNTEKTTDLY
ncbi:hypothetical protein SAMN05421747_107141 [Parapedobacter composti]|uniref:Repeat domain-containing protein n=1 Tax=Parapedobacter composti TaxID=623281 RepID=A0A1I1HV65_9SPHI|nr:hypothetical protein [Parapedobacter composti]SFC27957.1 hypothetical protein SAMN05421747_107141 [Parapedobacter composti]